MGDVEILLGLLALGLLIGVPTAAFVALARTGRLTGPSGEVAALRHRLEDLERQIAALRGGPDREAGQVEVPSAERPGEGVAEAPIVPAAPFTVVPAEELPPAEPVAAATAAEPPRAPVDALAEEVAAGKPVALEERIGSRIFVWVGGVALALAGAFLVKYSIDAGLLGPGVRVLLGILFGFLLLAAGEFMRSRSHGIAQALSAAGPACLYASLFAAVSLYGLVDRSVGFALLAAVTAGTISLSLRQGPFVGLVGLAGGFLTPLIVGGDEPNTGVLFTYLFLLQLGTQVLVRRRGWWWLAAVSVAGGMLWVLLWMGTTKFAAPPESQRIWPLLFLVGSALLASWSLRRPAGAPELLYTALGTQAAALCLTAAMVALYGYAGLEWLFFGGLAAFILLLARLRPAVEPLVVLAAGLGLLILGGWPEPGEGWLDLEFPSRFLTKAAPLGALFAFGGFIGLWGAQHKLRWAIFSAAASAAYFLVAYLRLRHYGDLPPWGYASLVLAALHLVAAERVARYRASNDEYRQALGVFALAVTGFVALAVPLELEHAWMAVAWSLQLVAIAWIERRLDIPWLRRAAWACGALVLLRLLPDPLLFPMPVGETLLFNWVLYGYGMPLAAIVAALFLFRGRAEAALVTALEAAAAVIAFKVVSLEIRHAFHGSDLLAQSLGLGELGSLIIAWLVMGLLYLLGGDWYRRPVLVWAGRAAIGLGAAALIVGALVMANPLLTPLSVGTTPILNLLLLAYALPAVLLLVIARQLERRGEAPWALAAGAFSILLGFVFLSLEVRQWFQGEFLDGRTIGDAETYAYSAAWLVYGGALLAGGILGGGRALRYASLAVVVLAVGKVFLFDAAQLTGLYRVASFLGLGLCLLSLGYVYQRLVFRPLPEARG